MSPVTTGAGISIGTVALVGGVIVVAGIAYLIYKSSDAKGTQSSSKPMKKLLEDDDKYNTYKTIISEAIKEQDWKTLEDFLDSRAKKYPDLVDMINKALKERK